MSSIDFPFEEMSVYAPPVTRTHLGGNLMTRSSETAELVGTPCLAKAASLLKSIRYRYSVLMLKVHGSSERK